ncbi:hypothetical protein AVEN_175951-1 [Araneus ventricosus]|uniref:DNA-directed DNA polymerase n=1 Tax=Araneus ventricosus TaxID=182803 RepID=A0A4Y2G790_ARAVE|nr:hypothetical protein AVEN_175951-1 [Araneus ventricosus]
MKKFDKTQDSSYLMYLDANNLYGWAMSQFLPTDGFKWGPTDIDVMQIPDDSPTGYILEIDLHYPMELHDKHCDFPLALDNQAHGNSKQIKLLTTLHDKEKCVIHYRNLKQCLKLGLKLGKIHRTLQFNQSTW